ncbi:RHS repeat-associated core domain-containing protein [Tenacibaculum maritimum]|uniref:RHS repeat domain-containing protein n=1 Tax=Tenacibaculum maritimum TaxID=107401 RepID=UPI00388E4563
MFGLNLGYKSTPIQAYDAKGNIVWECELDIYGKVGNLHGEKTFIPFRYQGQYEDIETGLYYNRFRYYSPDTGTYISKDPIGLAGNNLNLYAYVKDVNSWLDVLGLSSFDPFSVGEITDFPKDLHFGQNRIAPQFSDIGSQASDSIRGRNITDVVNDIKAGNIDPNEFLISYTKDPKTGKLVTLNNRGLAALSEAGKFPTDAIYVPHNEVPNRLLKDLGGKNPVGDILPSKQIAVTTDKAGKNILRTITNCN